MRDIDNPGNILKFNVRIAIDEHDALSASLEDIRQLITQLVPADVRLIDLQFGLGAFRSLDHTHDNSAIIGLRRSIRRWRLWNHRLKSMGCKVRDHHEDNEKHQQDINQGRHVDVGALSAAGTH